MGLVFHPIYLSYRPGSRNGKPDALSHQFAKGEEPAESPEPILPPTVVITALTWDIDEKV